MSDRPHAGRRRLSDTYLASFLLARGYRLAGTEPGPRTTFLFDDVPDDEILAYQAGAAVPARALFDAYRGLLAIVHAGRRDAACVGGGRA